MPNADSPSEYLKIVLKKGREVSVRRFHPWIFSGAIHSVSRKAQRGDVAHIFSFDGKPLATGHFEGENIAVKIIAFSKTVVDETFWETRLQNAFLLRTSLGLTNNDTTTTYRLVFSEGDMMPGLIIDIYGRVGVIQAQSAGMFRARGQIANALMTIYQNKLQAIYDRSIETVEGDPIRNRLLSGQLPEEIIVVENNHLFRVDVEKGQKTGFFLDQRDNRQRVAVLSRGRKVLNLFSYTGGFSVYALAAGASEVCSVDISGSAIAKANENILLNGLDASRHQGVVAEVKHFVEGMPDDFDLIIVDPPAFAKHQHSRHKAMLGYRFLNHMVIKKVARKGFIFTFSCSQAVDAGMFQGAVMAAAIDAGRDARIIGKLSHPPDHPCNVFHPEGEYLKGLVLQVD